jgi:hypothetical protein
MAGRTLPTWAVVALALTAGAFVGAALDSYLSLRAYRFDWQRGAQRALHYRAAESDPRQWVADSAREAAWRRAQTDRWLPREIGRTQARTHCVVHFEIRDTTYRRLQLFEANARDRSQTGVVIARGYAFSPHGYQRGDTVDVVFPDVWCGDMVVGGWSAGMIDPPPPSIGLDVR